MSVRRRKEIDSSIWREEIGNRNRLDNFGGKKSAIEIDSSLVVRRRRRRQVNVNHGGRRRRPTEAFRGNDAQDITPKDSPCDMFNAEEEIGNRICRVPKADTRHRAPTPTPADTSTSPWSMVHPPTKYLSEWLNSYREQHQLGSGVDI